MRTRKSFRAETSQPDAKAAADDQKYSSRKTSAAQESCEQQQEGRGKRKRAAKVDASEGGPEDTPAAAPSTKKSKKQRSGRSARGQTESCHELCIPIAQPCEGPNQPMAEAEQATEPPTQLKLPPASPVPACLSPGRSIRSPTGPCAAVLPAPTLSACFLPGDSSHVSLALSALSMDVTMPAKAAGEGANAAGQPAQVAGAPFGRQQQFQQLYTTISNAAKEGTGKSVYISGLPGTGKSHTVRAVIAALKANEPATAPAAVFVSCFGQKEPGDIYAAIYQQVATLRGHGDASAALKGLNPEQAYHRLTAYLKSRSSKPHGKASSKASSKSNKGGADMLVIVLDEVDRLLSARSGMEDMVRLFMMPHTPGVACSVVAMANSIDITERCLPELKLRGCAPVFMPFGAYLRVQLLSILTAKLSTLPWPVFEPSAVELVARKVASTTGDVRKALQACRIALRLLVEQCGAAVLSTTSPLRSPRAAPSTSHQLLPTSPMARSSMHFGSPSRAACISPTRSRPTGGAADPGLVTSAAGGPRPSPQRLPPTSPRCRLQLPTSPCGARLAPDGTAPGGNGGRNGGQLVGVKEMVAALSRLSYQSGAAASNVNAVKNLPQQQQVALLALASALATAAAAAASEAEAEAAATEHGLTTAAYRTKYYWGPSSVKKAQPKLANPFGKAPTTPASTQQHTSGGAAATPPTQTPGGGMLAGDVARAVAVSVAYEQYRSICTGMFQQPCSEQEFLATQQLLSHLGLVSVVGSGGGGVGGSSVKRGPGAGARCAHLLLKVAMRDIQAALKDSVVFRKVLAGLPSA